MWKYQVKQKYMYSAQNHHEFRCLNLTQKAAINSKCSYLHWLLSPRRRFGSE